MLFKKLIKNFFYNNLNYQLVNQLKNFNLKTKYYDIGASGGLQPRAKNYIELLNLFFIEPDCLKSEELKNEGYNVLNCALWSEENEITINSNKSQGTSSVFKPNYEYLRKFQNFER